MGNKKAERKIAGGARAGDGAEGDTPFGGLTEGRVLFLIVAATVLVYANSLGGQFLFDDTKQIVNNPSLRSWSNVVAAFTSDVWSFQRGTAATDIPPPYYRPLFTVYFTVAYKLFGLWEPGWHLLNLLVHVLVTVAVYYLVRRLSTSLSVAALAALLFGVHPAHVESVSWISGIPDPLAALFYVPALTWYVRHRQEGGRRRLAASLVAFALSLLCKETAIVLPLVIAVWEFSREGSGSLRVRAKTAALACVAFLGVAAGYLLIRLSVLGLISWKHPMSAQVSDSAVLLTVPFTLASYLRHLVAPFYLSLNYGTSFVRTASETRFLLPAFALAAIAVMLWVYRRGLTSQHRTALTLLLAPLLPVLNLRVFHEDYLIQDRYLYLPSVGFCYLVALLLVRLAERRRALALALGAALFIAFGAGTVLHNRVWNNALALWGRAVAYAPRSWSTHYNLGLAYMNKRDYAAARQEFLTAVSNNLTVAAVYNNLALAEDKLGNEVGAVAYLKRALMLDPNLHEARNNLGTIQFRKGDHKAAREQFELALRRDPTNDSVRFNLARVLAASGGHPAAIPLFEALLAASPGDTDARYQLAQSYAATGRKAEAVAHLQRAIADERVPERAAEMRAALDKIQK